MSENEKFLELVARTSKEGGQCSNWREEAEWRRDNRGWLRVSGKIAVAVLLAIDETPGMSKGLLAEKTGLDIDKIVKGSVDLTVGEIKILEDALGVVLIGKERRS